MLPTLFVLIPGLIAATYYGKIIKAKWKPMELLTHWGIFAFLINLFALGVIYLRGNTEILSVVFQETIRLLKYGAISCASAIALPNVLFLCRKIICKKNMQEQEMNYNERD